MSYQDMKSPSMARKTIHRKRRLNSEGSQKKEKKEVLPANAGAGNRTQVCCINGKGALFMVAVFHTPHPHFWFIYEAS
jgi:hypothetical protein